MSTTMNCMHCPPCLEAKLKGISGYQRQISGELTCLEYCARLRKDVFTVPKCPETQAQELQDRLSRLKRILDGHEGLKTTKGEVKERIQAASASASSDERVEWECAMGKRCIYCIICSEEISSCKCLGGYYGNVEEAYKQDAELIAEKVIDEEECLRQLYMH